MLIVLGIVLLLGFEQFAIVMMAVIDEGNGEKIQSAKSISNIKLTENNLEMQIQSTID